MNFQKLGNTFHLSKMTCQSSCTCKLAILRIKPPSIGLALNKKFLEFLFTLTVATKSNMFLGHKQVNSSFAFDICFNLGPIRTNVANAVKLPILSFTLRNLLSSKFVLTVRGYNGFGTASRNNSFPFTYIKLLLEYEENSLKFRTTSQNITIFLHWQFFPLLSIPTLQDFYISKTYYPMNTFQ